MEVAIEALNHNLHLERGATYLNITSVLSAMGLNNKALSFASKSVECCEKEKNKKHIGIAYHNLAI